VPIKVLHVGLGPIGVGIVRRVARRPGLVTAGGVDIDPALMGRDLGDVAGLRRRLAILVSGDLAATIKAVRPDVAIVSTTSSLRLALPVLETILKLKVPIISTTEELAYPLKPNAAMAKRLDALA
jgi:4-hydroxy-tetrahydrodipicolinate reductase